MPKRSAGILLYRRTGDGVELLAGHMGGPLWSSKDEHAWSIPKGELDPDEEPLAAARREFTEELGLPVPDVDLVGLGEAVQRSNGKLVTIWAGEADLDPAAVVPGTFTMQWPPRSGTLREFPEIDRVAWLSPDEARTKLVKGQAVFVDRLLELLSAPA
ncbi:NUDIX domain-containing protein [Kineococcus rhizosphaerae]|uniref:Putative NUDIX family NTP pyrophosphohydrolase n=1 Tax=Kineococcus rhizosphaerae TaxID=559628 RepID=A0A2T0QZH4_9ACTN|nr:NUDIX domain-containing protein [Kineococcus rhizosphaerae]PRY12096.1 putative NUDIX family NTP pyrophosphohydrolase [Kineococcus rhizosphaerae]